MLRLAGALAGVAIVAVVAVLVFGGDEPELSPQDQSTPTATPTATATPAPSAAPDESEGEIAVRIGDDGLDVAPRTITRDAGTLFLAYENTTGESVEVVLARGRPEGQAAIQKALITGAVIQAGQQRRDGVQVDPGRYTVLVRSPDERAEPTDTVSLDVR